MATENATAFAVYGDGYLIAQFDTQFDTRMEAENYVRAAIAKAKKD